MFCDLHKKLTSDPYLMVLHVCYLQSSRPYCRAEIRLTIFTSNNLTQVLYRSPEAQILMTIEGICLAQLNSKSGSISLLCVHWLSNVTKPFPAFWSPLKPFWSMHRLFTISGFFFLKLNQSDVQNYLFHIRSLIWITQILTGVKLNHLEDLKMYRLPQNSFILNGLDNTKLLY